MMQESLEAILALFRAAPASGSTVTATGSPCATRSCMSALHLALSRNRHRGNDFPVRATAGRPAGHVAAVAVDVGARRLRGAGKRLAGGLRPSPQSGQRRAGPGRLGVLGIMHLADSRDQAIEDCTYGLQDFAKYFGAAGFVPLANLVEGAQSPREFVEDYAPKAIAASAHQTMRSPTSKT
ncbi:limonene 1,2-monooxygenase domain protein, partial [Mycobacterium xenopi 3993]